MDAVRDGEVVVRLVGRLCVAGPAEREDVPSERKARRLLALLAAHRPRTVPTSEIVDALWDGRPPLRPEDNVATLVSRLRAAPGRQLVVLRGRRHRPALGIPVAHSHTMRQAEATIRAALPDWRSELDDLVGEGDIVVERFTASGTHTGPLWVCRPPGSGSSCLVSTSSGWSTGRSSSGGVGWTRPGCGASSV